MKKKLTLKQIRDSYKTVLNLESSLGKLVGFIGGVQVRSNPNVPKDEVYFINSKKLENSFKLKSPPKEVK